MLSKEQNSVIVKYDKVNISNLVLSTPKENKGGDIEAFFDEILIQTPYVTLNHGGVPSYHEKYYDTDEKRMFITFPLYHDDPETEKFASNFVKELDEKYGSDQFRKEFFGSKLANVYNKYFPIYSEAPEYNEEDPKQAKYGPKPSTMKIKLRTDYKDNSIKTEVYHIEMVDGKKTRTLITGISSIDEFKKSVPFKSRIRIICKMGKLWSVNKKKEAPYGITITALKIEVELPSDTNYSKQIVNKDMFIDSDEDNKSENIKPSKPEKSKPVKLDKSEKSDKNEPTVKVIDSDDDSVDKNKVTFVVSDSDEEVKPVKKTPEKKVPEKKVQKKVQKKDEVQDEDEDSDDIPIKTKVKKVQDEDSDDIPIKTKVKKVQDEDSDDIPIKTKVKKTPQKVVYDEDSDDIPVKPKAKKETDTKKKVDDKAKKVKKPVESDNESDVAPVKVVNKKK
jgi:hypothetical protein